MEGAHCFQTTIYVTLILRYCKKCDGKFFSFGDSRKLCAECRPVLIKEKKKYYVFAPEVLNWKILVKCIEKFHPGGVSELNLHFQGREKTREVVRCRDNHTCQNCKKEWIPGTRRFDCHHVNGMCGKKSRKYENLTHVATMVTLCHKCHFNMSDHSQDWSRGNGDSRIPSSALKDIVSMRKDGLSMDKIAEKYGVKQAAVWHFLDRNENNPQAGH